MSKGIRRRSGTDGFHIEMQEDNGKSRVADAVLQGKGFLMLNFPNPVPGPLRPGGTGLKEFYFVYNNAKDKLRSIKTWRKLSKKG